MRPNKKPAAAAAGFGVGRASFMQLDPTLRGRPTFVPGIGAIATDPVGAICAPFAMVSAEPEGYVVLVLRIFPRIESFEIMGYSCCYSPHAQAFKHLAVALREHYVLARQAFETYSLSCLMKGLSAV
jgi:hypothetical protein